uniref:Copper transport protein n=1 Tax=Setaria digitata TaxID=48799 RepID=A0A915PP90_9BILA
MTSNPTHGRLQNISQTNATGLKGFDPLASVKNFLDELAADHSGHRTSDHHMHNGEIMVGDSGHEHESPAMGHYHMDGMNDMTIGKGHDHVGHGHGNHDMKMWFHFGCRETILFEFWQINSLHGLLLSCLVIFLMGCLYEWIKWFRVYLQLSAARCPPSCRHPNNMKQGDIKQDDDKQDDDKRVESVQSSLSAPLTITLQPGYRQVSTTRTGNDEISFTVRLIQASLYLVQLILAYWLMLIAMTYNVWLTAAVVMGAAFGHWLFAILKCFNPQTDELDTFATDACH